MSYRYEDEKPWVLTGDGQRQLIALRDWVLSTLRTAGAFQAGKALAVVSTPDTFKAWALIDRLVELGDVFELPHQKCMSQHRIFGGRSEQ